MNLPLQCRIHTGISHWYRVFCALWLLLQPHVKLVKLLFTLEGSAQMFSLKHCFHPGNGVSLAFFSVPLFKALHTFSYNYVYLSSSTRWVPQGQELCIFEQINELIFHVFFSHDLKFMLSLNLSMILGMQGHIIYATNWKEMNKNTCCLFFYLIISWGDWYLSTECIASHIVGPQIFIQEEWEFSYL